VEEEVVELAQPTPPIVEEMVGKVLLIKRIIHMQLAQTVVEEPVAAVQQTEHLVPLMEMAVEEDQAPLVKQGVTVASQVVAAVVVAPH
jgi:hypothetical protein